MLGAGRDEYQRALAHRALVAADQHLAPAADNDVHLLLGPVAVQCLLAARLAFHPRDAQALGIKLALGEQQVGYLAVAALVARTAGEPLDVHDAIVTDRCCTVTATSPPARHQLGRL